MRALEFLVQFYATRKRSSRFVLAIHKRNDAS